MSMSLIERSAVPKSGLERRAVLKSVVVSAAVWILIVEHNYIRRFCVKEQNNHVKTNKEIEMV